VRSVVFLGVGLLDEDLAVVSEPATRPGFIGPVQAEREVGHSAGKHLVNRALEQSTAVEPVVPVAEALDAVALRQLGLGGPRIRQSQIVITHVRGQSRLIMPPEKGFGLGDVRPLREPFTPPPIVLGDRVKLR